jgi:sarcosine oxidase subunit alpha
MPDSRSLRDPVRVWFDGEATLAERGEPVAVALLAAGHLALARSPKFHRPRGPSCLRAACDGCLARVDEVPNVMTCRVPAEEGMRVETQNVAGSRDTDLLRVTDWFFPEGMDPHELLAGVPGAGQVMQAFARQVAGLGRLPAQPKGPVEARRRQVDVLVVGCGAAGMLSALQLAARGRQVEVVDDDLTPGGSLFALSGEARRPWEPLLGSFERAVAERRVLLYLRSTAAGVYGNDILVASTAGVEVVTARVLVLAPGAHDGTAAFEGNDLPGVMSARAAARLLGHGVRLGKKVVLARTASPAGPFGAAFAAARPDVVQVDGVPSRARGSARVRAVDVGGRELPCDLLVVEAPPAPAYELCAQAGAELTHEPRGFAVRTQAAGRIRDGVYACGEVTGAPLDLEVLERAARALAEQVEQLSPP